MKRFLIPAGLALLLVSGCGGQADGGEQDGPQGTVEMDESMSLAILVNDAMSEVDAVSYTFTFYGEGFLATELNAAHGTTDLMASDDLNYQFFLVTVDSCWAAGGIPVPSTFAMDGVTVYSLNGRDSVFASSLISDGGQDLLSFSSRMLMLEYIIDEPFSDEIHADSLAIQGMETVDGTDCDILHVWYAGGTSEAVWYLGAEDHLPRKVERIYRYQGEEGTMILELEDISFPDGFEDGHFVLEPPDGFTVETYSAFIPSGTPAPLWELPDPDGNMVSLESLRGSVVVLDFWATWCGPCREVMPALQALSIEFENSPLEVIGINIWENSDPVAFMSENGYTYTLLLEGDSVAVDYMVTAIPTFYVIDADGNIALGAKGASQENEDALRDMVESLLGE
jgi:thiol-disulfide isomerase/thioredoxin